MTAEEILKKHCEANENHSDKTPDLFTRFLIYNAMEEYASQQRTEGIKEGFEAARDATIVRTPYGDVNVELEHYTYQTADDYLNSKK